MISATQLENISNRVHDAVEKKRVSYALEQLESMAQSAMASWMLKDEINSLKEQFGYLRRYALDNIDDPERKAMFDRLLASIDRLSKSVVRESLIADSPRLYFSVLRYEQLQSDSSLSVLLPQLEDLADRMAMASLSPNPFGISAEIKNLHSEFERIARRAFDLVWVTYPLTVDDENSLMSFLNNERVRIELREHILSAVMLGALEYYDERRLKIMAKVYLSATPHIEIKALVALLISIWMQRDSLTNGTLNLIMDSLRERKEWSEDIKMAFLNLVRTRDADRITRTMNEELIPQMMKLRPEVFKKIRDVDAIDDISSLVENPEWDELISNSGVTEKLKELNELQSEGGDVMLSSFSSLKSFPFFNNVSNWFLPFYLEQGEVSRILGESAADLGEMIDALPVLCDSDKYSMVMSIETMPKESRRMMLEPLKMQAMNVAELRNSVLNADVQSRGNIANKFIQDLYRFFTLYRKKNEFNNPFASPINLASVSLFAEDLKGNDALEAVAEFYFKRKYFAEAYDAYKLLIETSDHTVSLMQKMGFCCQQLNDSQSAYEWYKKSELLSPDSNWIAKRLAQTLRVLGRYSEAIPYYERLSNEATEDVGLALSLGHCYLAEGEYKKALQAYYRAEYFDTKHQRALRPLAWCTFIEGDYEKSKKYYERVLAGNPDDNDYLNAGHLAMAMANYREAAKCYRQYLQHHNFDVEKLDNAIKADSKHLVNAGIDSIMLALVMDAAQYPEQ